MHRYLILLMVCLVITGSGVAYGELYSGGLNPYEEIGNMWFDSLNVRFVGNWPFGGSRAVAHDSVRNLAFCGSGGGVYILDVSSPSAPIKLSEGIHTRGIVYSLFYEASSQMLYIADGDAGLEIWDVADPSSPEKLGNYDTPGSACGLYVSGSYAYIGDGDSGLYVIDISAPSNPQQVGHYDTHSVGDIYIKGSFAYVASDGLRVIDISVPTNPQEVGYYNTPGGARCVYVSGSYAYVTSGYEGLRVIDVSVPSNPQEIGYYDTPGYAYWVCVSGSYAYVADRGALQVIDVSTPSDPQGIGYYDTPGSARCVYVQGFNAYVSADSAGLRVVDVSEPTIPQEVGYYNTPGYACDVYVLESYAYVITQDGLWVIDVSTPSNPEEVGHCNTPSSLCCTPEGSNCIYVSDSYAYIAADTAGLRIIDVSVPSDPQEIGNYDTPGFPLGVYVLGSYAYVADGEALRVIDISSPSNPQEVGHYDTPGVACGVYVSGSYAYVADVEALRVIDISAPANPQEIGHCFTYGFPVGVFVSPPFAYIAAWYGLSVIDISTPSNPQEVSYIFETDVRDVYVSNSYAYISCASDGFWVIDVSTPSDPQEVGYYKPPNGSISIYASGSYAYTTMVGLQIYENLLEGAKNPQSEINPSSFQVSLQTNQTINQDLTISNYGDAFLTWGIDESPSVDWLLEDTTSGWLNPGDSMSVTLTFDATGLNLGNYYDTLVVSSNDPNNPAINVPIQLTVYTGDKIFVYPSPGFPRSGSRVLTFANLPDEGKIYVYTLSGSLVWKHSFTNIDKYYSWNGKNQFGNDIASGIYFYYVENKSGDVLIKGKFAVVR
ncbi:hypothetical protein KAU13_07375 [candidate division WOR-3 bacterium]|nr:hypothetical protein [candidate division WOR-3 bacterium]